MDEAPVGEAELARAERDLQLVGQRILPVVVPADGGGLPRHGPDLQQYDPIVLGRGLQRGLPLLSLRHEICERAAVLDSEIAR